MFPISRRPEDTYIAGLSMGGFGALIHGLSHPEKYAAIGSFSGAVALHPGIVGDLAKGIELEPEALVKKLIEEKKQVPPLYIACGEKDALYQVNCDFRESLESMGLEVTWVPHPDYDHEWRFWDMQAEAYLDWIPRTDSYAKQGRRQV